MNILFLTHRLPYAPNRGDRVRAFHMLQTLAPRHDVELVSLVHDADEEAQAETMRRQGLQVTTAMVPRLANHVRAVPALAGSRALTHVLLDSPAMPRLLRDAIARRRPDVVLAYCSGMARFALERPLSLTPYVLDMVDVDSCKWSSLAMTTPQPRRWIYGREARLLSRFEAVAAERAAETLVVNEREHAALAALNPAARIRIVRNGVDVEPLTPTAPPTADSHVVFCGVMNYAPNEQATLWFVRSAWPRVRAAHPNAHLSVVGADPTPAIRALARRDASITVTGRVSAVAPYLWKAAVSIAPIMTARGIQNKVIEAIAAGLPCVVTPTVRDGLPFETRAACLVADGGDAFADAVIALLDKAPEERRAFAARSDLRSLTWRSTLAELPDVLAAAASRKAGR